ncbi:MAG: DUF2062 domain-containing protein, partial [Hymenobacteraceae bacterium]|nr:DUF2062 domain-containing protein [Hymenobacteraceae bacterium]
MNSPQNTNFFKRKFITPLLDLLKQGLTPEKLSLTVAIGAVVGLIPVFGVTTVFSTLLALRLRLNVAGTV